MIAGLPIEAWLLLILSVGIPLAIELKFFFTHRNEKRNGSGESEK
jgi:hypothetical protein